MASYWCYGPPDDPPGTAFAVPNTSSPTGYTIHLKVAYVGSDVPDIGGDPSRSHGPFVIQDRQIQIEVLFADTPAVILGKVVDQVVGDAASIGITVARNAGLVSSFIRGV